MADAGLDGFRCHKCGYVWATAIEMRNVLLLPKPDRRRESKKAAYAGPARRKDDRVKN